jgi:hypothetical protein
LNVEAFFVTCCPGNCPDGAGDTPPSADYAAHILFGRTNLGHNGILSIVEDLNLDTRCVINDLLRDVANYSIDYLTLFH